MNVLHRYAHDERVGVFANAVVFEGQLEVLLARSWCALRGAHTRVRRLLIQLDQIALGEREKIGAIVLGIELVHAYVVASLIAVRNGRHRVMMLAADCSRAVDKQLIANNAGLNADRTRLVYGEYGTAHQALALELLSVDRLSVNLVRLFQ